MKIINIGILAHVDAGKTTLTESLLYTSGAIAEQGNVDKGTTRTDTIKQIIFFITCSPFIHMVWNIYEPILTKHWNPLLIYGLTIITIEGTNFGQRETIILRNF